MKFVETTIFQALNRSQEITVVNVYYVPAY